MRGMVDVIAWATSPAGVITQAAIALVCQVIGFLIVVTEIVEARAGFRRLVNRYREIEDEMERNLQKHLDTRVLTEEIRADVRAAKGILRMFIAIFVGLFISLPMRATVEIQSATLRKIHELVAQDATYQHPRRPWVGAAFLLAGIVFSFTGQVSGVK